MLKLKKLFRRQNKINVVEKCIGYKDVDRDKNVETVDYVNNDRSEVPYGTLSTSHLQSRSDVQLNTFVHYTRKGHTRCTELNYVYM